MTALVFINQEAGEAAGDDRVETIRRLFADAGTAVEVDVCPGDQLAERVRGRLSGPPRLIVAAGGDGTVRTVASLVADTEHSLGVLPLGTMNVFARSLDIPLELEEAVAALLSGSDRKVDLCRANDQLVVNNASAGSYAKMCALREQRRARHKRWPKIFRWTYDTIAALYEVMNTWGSPRVRVTVDGTPRALPSPFFLVSNNSYTQWAQAGRRTDGLLTLLVPRANTPSAMIWAILRTMIRGPENVDEVEVLSAREIEILGRGAVPAAIDGEVETVSLPLRFRAWPQALTVRAPRPREQLNAAA